MLLSQTPREEYQVGDGRGLNHAWTDNLERNDKTLQRQRYHSRHRSRFTQIVTSMLSFPHGWSDWQWLTDSVILTCSYAQPEVLN